MANSSSARKRVRREKRRQQRNIVHRSMMRTAVKKTVLPLRNQDYAAAETAYRKLVPILDQMVSKGIIHKNKASRYKLRLNSCLRALAPA